MMFVLAGLLAAVLTACSGAQEPAAVEVEASGFDFMPARLSAQAGAVTVKLNNTGAIEHTFVIEEKNDTTVVSAEPGTMAEGTIELEPGTYNFYCDVQGHREAGMRGNLDVN